jgi:hypothetical protein
MEAQQQQQQPPPSAPAPYPSYDVLALSTLRGGAAGAAVGLGFHAIGGGLARAQGQRAGLTAAHVARQGALAAARLAALGAGYAAVRGGLRRALGSDALACMGAGGAVVCGATLAQPSRLAFLQGYYASVLARGGGGVPAAPVPLHLLLVTSFASGAIVLGGLDLALLHSLRMRW